MSVNEAVRTRDVSGDAGAGAVAQERSWVLAWTSLFFILLQSVCSAFMAISGLRLLIGVGSLAAATSGAKFLDRIHGGPIRIPMMIFAVAGSVINLYSIWRARRLRARPSSQWRMQPLAPAKRRAEAIQIGIALMTLVLIGVEWVGHVRTFGGLLR
ncbi:hypothetical protein [Granulicella tundricola]|uniref:Uncharacterized protein n=1 Tax=Granulicella tundricola (strain ATCC BAA-1859 / DSM 23138 / MP5ACTX9) TaxID=1198114 RepID=E8X568_GRATM|nr:hypothetical protein [Granulicella tundricola]ADW68332.1 hypothetical protein AciX9_1270 [Granulicella tundricola MP5ACTX9]